MYICLIIVENKEVSNHQVFSGDQCLTVEYMWEPQISQINILFSIQKEFKTVLMIQFI